MLLVSHYFSELWCEAMMKSISNFLIKALKCILQIEYRAYCTRHSAAHMGKASVTLNEGFDAGTSQSKPTDVAEKSRGNGTLAGIKPLEDKVEVLSTEQTPLSSSVVRPDFVDDVHISAEQPQIDSGNLDHGSQINVVTPVHSALESERGEGEGSKVSGLNEGLDPLQSTRKEQQASCTTNLLCICVHHIQVKLNKQVESLFVRIG